MQNKSLKIPKKLRYTFVAKSNNVTRRISSLRKMCPSDLFILLALTNALYLKTKKACRMCSLKQTKLGLHAFLSHHIREFTASHQPFYFPVFFCRRIITTNRVQLELMDICYKQMKPEELLRGKQLRETFSSSSRLIHGQEGFSN